MMASRRASATSSLRDLLDGVATLDARFDCAVSALTLDSRRVRPGSLFFARRGGRVDGARFASDAARAGAVAMVEQANGPVRVDEHGLLRIPVADVEAAVGTVAHRFFQAPSEDLPVVAVTGTNGKTSVCHLVASALESLARGPVGILGTLGSGLSSGLSSAQRAGNGPRFSDIGLTTPDCIAVHGSLARFRDAGARAAVMEASSHALDQQRLAGVRVHTAVFTNLSRDHLDYHGSMDAYARAKARLFALPGLRHAVINAADPAAGTFRAAAGRVPVTTFALDAPEVRADLAGHLRRSTADGVTLDLTDTGGVRSLRSPLLGAAAAWNLLCAYGVLRALEVDAPDAVRALSQARPVPGRMQRLGGDGSPVVVVDYSHTPAALAGALETLAGICAGTLWCVFGAGGERDPGKRPLMGEVAARFAQTLVITDDNPRGEDGQSIIEDILAGVPAAARATAVVERDRARAIARAVAEAAADDIVLVAGKGHETYQEVAGERRPFSDVAAVRAALEARGA